MSRNPETLLRLATFAVCLASLLLGPVNMTSAGLRCRAPRNSEHGLTLSCSSSTSTGSRPAIGDGTKELQQKRVVVLKQVHDLTVRAYGAGDKNASFDKVLEAKITLFTAMLELAETKTERIRICNEIVKQAEELEKTVLKLSQGGQASRIDVLKAQAYVLETQINLEKAKNSQ